MPRAVTDARSLVGTAPRRTGGDADTIELKWDKPANDGGAAITSYELQVRTVADDAGQRRSPPPPPSSAGDNGTTAECHERCRTDAYSGSTLITNLVEGPHYIRPRRRKNRSVLLLPRPRRQQRWQRRVVTWKRNRQTLIPICCDVSTCGHARCRRVWTENSPSFRIDTMARLTLHGTLPGCR